MSQVSSHTMCATLPVGWTLMRAVVDTHRRANIERNLTNPIGAQRTQTSVEFWSGENVPVMADGPNQGHEESPLV